MAFRIFTSEQLRAARALLNWTQADLANGSGVALMTVRRMETKPGLITGNIESLSKVHECLETAGISFVFEGGTDVIGVTLHKKR